MKKVVNLLIILIVPLLLLVGCNIRDQVVYNGNKIKLTFNVKGDYKLEKSKKYLRNAREKAIFIGSTFKIGIEVNDLEDNKSFDDYKKEYKKEEDFKEVTYSGMNGFQFYTPSYLRYEIYLPVNDKIVLRLNVYSANDNKKSTTKELESSEVQDILDNMDVEAKK